MRVLVTRPLRDAEATARRLMARGHEAVIAPVLDIVATDAATPAGRFEALIATSAHAIELASRDILKQHVASPLWCVGARTEAAARGRGFSNVKEAAAGARDLAARIIARAKPHSHYLYLAGLDRKPFLEHALGEGGHHVDVVIVYEARAAAALPGDAVAALRAGAVDAALHFSRRSAELVMALAAREEGAGDALRRLKHICISADAAAPLRAVGLDPGVAAKPDLAGLLAALEGAA